MSNSRPMPDIHFKVSVPGRKPLTTQLYLRGGEKAIRFDTERPP